MPAKRELAAIMSLSQQLLFYKANNIQVGGVGTGIPSASTASLAAGLTGVSNLTANVSQMAQASADMGKDNDKDEKKKKQLGTISVELIGFGT